MNIVKMKNNKEVVLRLPLESDAMDIIKFYNIVAEETTYLSFGKDEYKVSVEAQESIIKSTNESDNNTMVLATIENEIVGIGTISSNQKKKENMLAY